MARLWSRRFLRPHRVAISIGDRVLLVVALASATIALQYSLRGGRAPQSQETAKMIAKPERPDARTTPADGGAPVLPSELPTETAVKEILARPLFKRSRRPEPVYQAPPPPPPQQPAEPPPPSPPLIVLKGRMAIEGKSFVLVEQGPEITAYTVGDMLFGWKIASIEDHSMTLTLDIYKHEYSLQF